MSQNTHYELTLIIDSNILENEYSGKIEKIKKVIEKNQGNISSEFDLGRKKLSYPIKKMFKGNFYSLEIDMEPQGLSPIEKELKLNKDILRYIFIKKPANIKAIEELDTKKQEETKEKPKKIREIKTQTVENYNQEGKDFIAETTNSSPNQTPKAPILKTPIETEEKSSPQKKESQKTDLDELDKKLDEILNDEIID